MSSKGTTQFFQSGLSKWLQNYNRFIPFVSFRRRGQSIDRVGSLLKHKSSAFFVCVFQALGCWEINDWLKLKLPWEVVGFCVVWMGFGTFLGVLLVFFFTHSLGYFRGWEWSNLEQSLAVSRRNRRIKHLDFLSILSYVMWGWKALKFLLELLWTLSGLGTGLEPKQILLPVV